MSNETDNPELAALATALAALAPSAGDLDRDRLLYSAGQRSVRRHRWHWPALCAALALVAVALGVLSARRPETRLIEQVVYVKVPASEAGPPHRTNAVSSDFGTTATNFESDSRPSSPLSCFRLEQVALRWGVEGLPEPRPTAPSTNSSP